MKLLNSLFIMAALFLAATPAFAKDASGETSQVPLVHCELALSGTTVALEFHAPASPDQPTFLMIAGLVRPLHSSDEAHQRLVESGAGIISLNFSPQPFSLAGGSERPVPDATLELLRQEIGQVLKLAESRGIKNIIPVPLSFGAAVAAPLSGFELIIDLVPLTSADAKTPQLQAFRSMLEAGEWFNPIFGKQNTRDMIDQSYRSVWPGVIDLQIKKYGLPEERKAAMVEGGVRLSRAVEGFEWDKAQVDKAQRRVVVLAANESSSLLRHQKQTAARMLSEGYNIQVYLAEESGHDIFDDQPVTLVQILLDSVRNRDSSVPSLIKIKPSTGERTELTGRAAIAALK